MTLCVLSRTAIKHSVTWNGKDNNGMAVGSGVYGSQIKVSGYTEHAIVNFNHKGFGELFAPGDWTNKDFGQLFAPGGRPNSGFCWITINNEIGKNSPEHFAGNSIIYFLKRNCS